MRTEGTKINFHIFKNSLFLGVVLDVVGKRRTVMFYLLYKKYFPIKRCMVL